MSDHGAHAILNGCSMDEALLFGRSTQRAGMNWGVDCALATFLAYGSSRAGRWHAQGKCTPLRFTWKDNAINVGKLMRYELVKELQHAGPDVEVECTGDPTELTELKIKDEVRPADEPALPGLQTGRRCRPRLHVARW